MPLYRIDWSMNGSVTIEADDPTEAEQVLSENLPNLDHSQFESIDCEDVIIDSTEVEGA